MPGINVNVANRDGTIEFVGRYYGSIERGIIAIHHLDTTTRFDSDPSGFVSSVSKTIEYLTLDYIQKAVEISNLELQEAMWGKAGNLYERYGIDEDAWQTNNLAKGSVLFGWKEVVVPIDNYDTMFDLPEFDPDGSVRDKSERNFDYNRL